MVSTTSNLGRDTPIEYLSLWVEQARKTFRDAALRRSDNLLRMRGIWFGGRPGIPLFRLSLMNKWTF